MRNDKKRKREDNTHQTKISGFFSLSTSNTLNSSTSPQVSVSSSNFSAPLQPSSSISNTGSTSHSAAVSLQPDTAIISSQNAPLQLSPPSSSSTIPTADSPSSLSSSEKSGVDSTESDLDDSSVELHGSIDKNLSILFTDDSDSINLDDKEEFHSDNSPSSSGSPSSPFSQPATLGKEKKNDPVIETSFDSKTREFRFVISAERPGTSVKKDGKSVEGAHVTAHAVILEVIYAAIQDEPVDNIADILIGSASIFLDDASTDTLRTLVANEVDFIQKNVMERDERKELTRNLRALLPFLQVMTNIDVLTEKQSQEITRISASLNDRNIEKIKFGLKIDYSIHYTSLITKVAKFFIQHAAKLEGIAREIPEGHIERYRERISIQALRSFNRLLEVIYAKDDGKRSLFDEFKADDELTAGLRDTHDGLRIKVRRIGILITKSSPYEQIEFIKNNKLHDSAIRVGYLIEGLFDYYATKSIVREDIELLFEAIARHIAFIFTAFKHLKSMESNLKNAIVDSFLNEVLKSQGWRNCQFLDGMIQVQLDLFIFKQKVYSILEDDYYTVYISIVDPPHVSILSQSSTSSSVLPSAAAEGLSLAGDSKSSDESHEESMSEKSEADHAYQGKGKEEKALSDQEKCNSPRYFL